MIDILCKDIVNEQIVAIYKDQHNGSQQETHWHVGDIDNLLPTNNIPFSLWPSEIIKNPISKIIYELLNFEFKYGNYPLGNSLLENNYMDPCTKIYPLEDLNCNNLIIKTYNPFNVDSNGSFSIFFSKIGYAVFFKGQSKLIENYPKLGNLPIKENIYLITNIHLTISGYDFLNKQLFEFHKYT